MRRVLESNPALARQVLAHGGAMPMIFQYNPADFFIESNADGELLVTICRPRYVAPKVRYNIHDVGHVMRYPELVRRFREAGIDAGALDPDALDLPLLFHYGRSDLSVSYYGCKIPPADIQEALFRVPDMGAAADAFQLTTWEDDDGDKRLTVALEVADALLTQDADAWGRRLFDALADINQDFRESRRMVPAGKEPAIAFHALGTGPFANADIRIKRVYVRSVAERREQDSAGARRM